MEEKIEITVDSKDTYNTIRRMEAYSRFLKIITDKGITPYNISKNTGVATSTLSDWKNGKSMPKSDKMKVISDYIGADMDFIIYGEEKSHTDSIAAEYIDVMDMYARLSDEEKDQVVNMMKLFLKNK